MAENIIKLTKEQKELIERLGVLNEGSGLQPAPAKILALMIVSDEPELTFDQISETLNISKSATSNALNNLLTTKQIVYKTKFGERKRYFYSDIASWEDHLKTRFEELTQTAALFKVILAQRPAKTKEFNESLKNVVNFLEFIAQELPALYKKWDKQRS